MDVGEVLVVVVVDGGVAGGVEALGIAVPETIVAGVVVEQAPRVGVVVVPAVVVVEGRVAAGVQAPGADVNVLIAVVATC